MSEMKKPNQPTGVPTWELDENLPDRGRSPTEREILRVLWASPGEPLVRADVHRRLPKLHQPTPGRVSQILKSLDSDGLLGLSHGRSQGSPNACFFKLSPLGVRLCRHIGFDREMRFQVGKDDLSKYLTPEHLAHRPEKPPGPIVAFYSQRDGVGRTTTVGNVARGLAEKVPGRAILFLDLHLGESGHPSFFGPEAGKSCRGLHGLVVDYQGQPSWNQAKWLKAALTKRQYVDRPLPEHPNLYYLPTGLPEEPGGLLSAGEWAETLAFLRRSLSLERLLAKPDETDTKNAGFLQLFRTALVETFRRTVIDSQAGESLGAALAIYALADDLAVCVRLSEPSPMIGSGLRSAIVQFFKRREAQGAEIYGPLFISLFRNPKLSSDPKTWINNTIVVGQEQCLAEYNYRIENVDYDIRIDKDPRRQDRSKLYSGVVTQLEEPPSGSPKTPSTEMQALLQILDLEAPYHRRSVVTGFLANTSTKKLLKCLKNYSASQAGKVEIDKVATQLIHNVARTQIQKLEELSEELKSNVEQLTGSRPRKVEIDDSIDELRSTSEEE